jgi:hypothetical protein
LALAIASFKPTFGLPLGILLLVAGQFRTVVLGWGLGFVIGVAGLMVIFARSGDLPRMPEILRHNQEVVESDPEVDARTSLGRFDSAGALQRLLPVRGAVVGVLASSLVLGIAAWGLWPLRGRLTDPAAGTLAVCITSLAVVVGIFHMGYDGMLLWAPICAVGLAPSPLWPMQSLRWRRAVATLLLVPMLNILVTATVQGWLRTIADVAALPAPLAGLLWTFLAIVNGLALLAALVLLAQAAWLRAAPGLGMQD